MYNQTLDCKFDQPKLVAVTKNHETVQQVVVKFDTDFTQSIARALGYEHDYKDLSDGGKPKAEYEVGAVRCQLDLQGPVTRTLKGCFGVKAVAKVGKTSKKNPEPTPRITFEFQTHWEEDDIVAISKAFGKRGAIRITKEQTSLMDDEGKPTVRKGKGKK